MLTDVFSQECKDDSIKLVINYWKKKKKRRNMCDQGAKKALRKEMRHQRTKFY